MNIIFHSVRDMLLLIRAFNIFEMEEYFMHLNSIMNQDPTNMDTFLFKLTWIKKKINYIIKI